MDNQPAGGIEGYETVCNPDEGQCVVCRVTANCTWWIENGTCHYSEGSVNLCG